jgi:two-component system chemotaxis response regulator CheB
MLWRFNPRSEGYARFVKQTRDLVVVGASAGGVEALRAFASGLPSALPAAVLVVLHLPAGGTSALASILDRAGPLPAEVARAGRELEHGLIQVARPDHHLLVLDGEVALSRGPTENGHRPAVNALFRSAALARGSAVTGVQLSGALDDGVAGLLAIAARGGQIMVQDPAEALHPSMPEQAVRHVRPDHVLAAADMGEVLAKIAHEDVDVGMAPPPSELLILENYIATNGENGNPAEQHPESLGAISGFGCPDCHGALVEIDAGRYRCQVGHAWTADALLEAQGSAWQRALWSALRALDEKAQLSRRMIDYARERGAGPGVVDRYQRSADESSAAAKVLRRSLTTALARGPDQP